MKTLLLYTTILVSLVIIFTILSTNQPNNTLGEQDTMNQAPIYISEEDDQFEKTTCPQMINDIVVESPYECLNIDMNYYYKPPSINITNYCDFPFIIDGQQHNDLELSIELGVGEYNIVGEIEGEEIILSGTVTDCL